jgi:hypothetical protein
MMVSEGTMVVKPTGKANGGFQRDRKSIRGLGIFTPGGHLHD